MLKSKTAPKLKIDIFSPGSLLVSRVQLLPVGAGNSPHKADNSPHLMPELLSLAEPARLKAKIQAAEKQASDGFDVTIKNVAACAYPTRSIARFDEKN